MACNLSIGVGFGWTRGKGVGGVVWQPLSSFLRVETMNKKGQIDFKLMVKGLRTPPFIFISASSLCANRRGERQEKREAKKLTNGIGYAFSPETPKCKTWEWALGEWQSGNNGGSDAKGWWRDWGEGGASKWVSSLCSRLSFFSE